MLSLLFLLNSIAQLEPANAEFNLEYVRPAGEQFVLESTVSYKKSADGFLFQSVTHRPGEKMKLTQHWNAKHVLQRADLEQESAAGKHTATALLDHKTVVLKRPGQKDQQLTLAGEPVLATTAPDWSNILLVLRRYDPKQGGKQRFTGLWFHPVKPPLDLALVVEEVGKDTIPAGAQKMTLSRYRVQLRSGAYLVWVDGQGKVFKLMPPGRPQGAVILKGQEKAMAGLIGR
jgi:hypothetical protein